MLIVEGEEVRYDGLRRRAAGTSEPADDATGASSKRVAAAERTLGRQVKVGFVRFVLSKQHPESGVDAGPFGVAYAMRDAPDVASQHREVLRDCLTWFATHLPTPDRFNRSKSKGHYRRNTRGIAWFRDSAAECIARMRQIATVLEANGHPVTMIREERVGYLVYDDELQVIAEPFADTHTRPD